MAAKPPYQVEGGDFLVVLSDMPKIDVGAPMPQVVATERQLELSYLNPLLSAVESDPEAMTVVRFSGAIAHYFGPPNDEALAGHPLFGRGLQPYSAFEVKNSSWVQALEVMNRVHSYHDPRRCFARRHFVFTFHDSTFECVADSYQVEETHAQT